MIKNDRSNDRMKSVRGFTLVEMMIAMAIVGLVFYLSSGSFTAVVQRGRIAKNTSAVMLTKGQLSSLLRDDISWQVTLDNSAEFACWVQEMDCAGAPANRFFTPLEADGSPYLGYDPVANANHGFDLDGQRCTTFNPADPDPSCPFRFTFRRNFVCPPAPADCVKPTVVVQMIFDASVLNVLNQKVINVLPGQQDTINPNLYITTFSKKGVAKSVTPYICPDGQAVYQVLANGVVSCLDWASL